MSQMLLDSRLVLCCIVWYCIVLHCAVLYCAVLYFVVLHGAATQMIACKSTAARRHNHKALPCFKDIFRLETIAAVWLVSFVFCE